MKDIIRQLPDRLANQIAAGEVIQRPASVVKELLENAVDAGATEILMIVRDAGKELIQVVDNGKGMSPMDARMCFERHATSKIQNIEDLFAIRTMGFRGEAMASIAAVAQVEMITRQQDDEAGTEIHIEGSVVTGQESVAAIPGTNISVKNLFYNVPARRKFLKSNNAEWRHIVDEFVRVAIAYPGISFRLVHNDAEQFNLRAGTLKSRIVDTLGGKFDKYLVNVEETTDYLKVYGFIGKPEVAARTKSNQFFFINNRFIKSTYLHHAIATAYEGLITKEEQPLYVLYFEMDPAKVDVNVHPTKQEVKFEDDRTVYSYIKSIVRHVLAKYNIAPSLDFSLDQNIQQLESINQPATGKEIARASEGYLSNSFSQPYQAHFIDKINSGKNWERERNTFFDNVRIPESFGDSREEKQEQITFPSEPELSRQYNDMMRWNDYLITTSISGIMIIDIDRAHERIVYDRLIERYQGSNAASQQLLYPEMIEYKLQEKVMIEELMPEFRKIGFEMSSMGGNTYAIHAVPPELQNTDIRSVIEEILEAMEYASESRLISIIDKTIRTAAKRAKPTLDTDKAALQGLIAQLFTCSQPEYTPGGERIIYTVYPSNLGKLF